MKGFALAILLVCVLRLAGQEVSYDDNIRSELHATGRLILEHPEYQKRDSANRHFAALLTDYLKTEEGFNDPLTEVNNMMRLAPEKAGFAIYTWLMPNEDFKYEKSGLVAAVTGRGIVVTPLKDISSGMEEPEYRVLKKGDWYGAVYYNIIPVKKGKDRLYTLLGFAPDDELNRKIIDVIEVDKRGNPRFGARIFRVEAFMDKIFPKAPMRLIMYYSGEYSTSVEWNEEEEMIVMDHLAPPDAKLRGVYRTYGPDMSYDGLKWEDDWWRLSSNVKFDTGMNIPIVPPSKPVGPPPNSSLIKSKRTK